MKKFALVSYKGKFYIWHDKDCLDDMDFVVGEISKEDALKNMQEQVESSIWFGVPAYIGSDEDLKREEKKWLDASPNLYRE